MKPFKLVEVLLCSRPHGVLEALHLHLNISFLPSSDERRAGRLLCLVVFPGTMDSERINQSGFLRKEKKKGSGGGGGGGGGGLTFSNMPSN